MAKEWRLKRPARARHTGANALMDDAIEGVEIIKKRTEGKN